MNQKTSLVLNYIYIYQIFLTVIFQLMSFFIAMPFTLGVVVTVVVFMVFCVVYCVFGICRFKGQGNQTLSTIFIHSWTNVDALLYLRS